jgi:hypothetical protein
MKHQFKVFTIFSLSFVSLFSFSCKKQNGVELLNASETTSPATATSAAAATAGTLIFNSGFESGSNITPIDGGSQYADIVGTDNSVPAPNNWVSNLESYSKIGEFQLQYGSNDATKSKVEIINEPGKTNKVLRYWMNSPNEGLEKSYGGKFRIQTALIGNSNLKEFTYKVRLFLTSDWTELTSRNQAMDWFILQEFWNNAGWTGEPYPFRIHLTINKATGTNAPLRLGIEGEQKNDKWEKTWVAPTNNNFALPINKWMEMTVYMKEGNASNGRYKLTITPEGESPVVVYDVTNFTHHPSDPRPNGFAHINQLKGYSHKDNILYVKSRNKTLQFYWDDFKMWDGKL